MINKIKLHKKIIKNTLYQVILIFVIKKLIQNLYFQLSRLFLMEENI